MGRQPFSPKHDGKPTSVGLGEVKKNSRLASLIGICANGWSHVDLHLSLAMGALLGIENPASVAVFAALRNTRSQREALQAAARVTLSEQMLEIFEAIMSVHKSLDGQRNDVVHGIWGVSSAIPDAVVWESMQSHANMVVGVYHKEKTGFWNDGVGHAQHMTKGYQVYKYSDLEQLNRDIESLSSAIRNFHAYLRYQGTPAGTHALAELNSEPLLVKARAEMSRLRGSATAD